MQVSKWGNSLAIRLPASVVEALELKEDDEVEVHAADDRAFGIARDRSRERALARIRRFARNSLLSGSLIARRPTPGKVDAGRIPRQQCPRPRFHHRSSRGEGAGAARARLNPRRATAQRIHQSCKTQARHDMVRGARGARRYPYPLSNDPPDGHRYARGCAPDCLMLWVCDFRCADRCFGALR